MADDLRWYARTAASRAGIDADNFEHQIDQESSFNPDAHNDASDADGIAQIVVRWHPSMAGKTRDPYASLDYAAGLMRNHLAVYDGDWALALSAYNAGPGNTANGLAGKLEGWPYAETVRYVSSILRISPDDARARLTGRTGGQTVTVTYNRAEPAIAQNDAWSCAPTSTRWALTAVGRHPAESWMEAQMIADGIVSTTDGLLDASGKQLAAWITKQYGEFGYSASNEPRGISWEALAAEFMAPSNPYPGLIGGSAWNHWSGLRSYDPQRDVLVLANPADGWQGVSQTMSRQQFGQLGPFSLVRVIHPDLIGAAPAPPAPPAPSLPTRADWIDIRDRISALIERMPA